MYFDLEKTPAKKATFNYKSNIKYNWLTTLPWHIFGIDASDGIEFQEIINLQRIVGADADGLVGLQTLHKVQASLRAEHSLMWNPCTGDTSASTHGAPIMYWNGLEVPLNICACPVITYKDPEGIDLHFTGNFTKRPRNVNSVVVHWGGLNPQHLGRVFANRKASSHIAVGRNEDTGEVAIYQMIDLAHATWHAVGANRNSIGIDICQQPELKHLGYYKRKGYNVGTIPNPSHPKYGPAKIVSLDPEIEEATAQLLMSLRESFGLSSRLPSVAEGKVSAQEFGESGGIFSHFHVDHKGQGKWDVAPWWDQIISTMECRYVNTKV